MRPPASIGPFQIWTSSMPLQPWAVVSTIHPDSCEGLPGAGPSIALDSVDVPDASWPGIQTAELNGAPCADASIVPSSSPPSNAVQASARVQFPCIDLGVPGPAPRVLVLAERRARMDDKRRPAGLERHVGEHRVKVAPALVEGRLL